MALVRRPVTPRMIEANRRNAARCTGPRTAAGKARSRLNALRHGRRSGLLRRYFCLWRDVQLATPLEPPPPWNASRMPVPLLPSTGPGKFRGRMIQELLLEVAVYLAPRPGETLGRHAQTILFDDRNRQVIESKGGVFEQTEKQTENQPETKRPALGFGLAMGESFVAPGFSPAPAALKGGTTASYKSTNRGWNLIRLDHHGSTTETS